jgi:hypothetical protein
MLGGADPPEDGEVRMRSFGCVCHVRAVTQRRRQHLPRLQACARHCKLHECGAGGKRSDIPGGKHTAATGSWTLGGDDVWSRR